MAVRPAPAQRSMSPAALRRCDAAHTPGTIGAVAAARRENRPPEVGGYAGFGSSRGAPENPKLARAHSRDKKCRALRMGRGMEAAARAASSAARGRTVTGRLPLWVLIGAFLGILAGITFGERTAVLKPLGDVYTMMLLSVVYPYLLSSLIVGLGSLATGRAWRLLQASWGVYLFLWVAVFAAIFALAQAIPPPPPPVEIKPPHPISVLALLQTIVPDNLTDALSRNFVPAIIVFAVTFGLAVQSIPSKASFLETMEAIRLASLKVWAWVVYLAPIGV